MDMVRSGTPRPQTTRKGPPTIPRSQGAGARGGLGCWVPHTGMVLALLAILKKRLQLPGETEEGPKILPEMPRARAELGAKSCGFLGAGERARLGAGRPEGEVKPEQREDEERTRSLTQGAAIGAEPGRRSPLILAPLSSQVWGPQGPDLPPPMPRDTSLAPAPAPWHRVGGRLAARVLCATGRGQLPPPAPGLCLLPPLHADPHPRSSPQTLLIKQLIREEGPWSRAEGVGQDFLVRLQSLLHASVSPQGQPCPCRLGAAQYAPC